VTNALCADFQTLQERNQTSVGKKETNQDQALSKKNNSKVPGSNANPIIPDGEETPETNARNTKRKRATVTVSDRRTKKMNAAQQREERIKIQANKARMEAEAKAAAIATAKESSKKLVEEMKDLQHQFNEKQKTRLEFEESLKQQQPQQQQNQRQTKLSDQRQRKTNKKNPRRQSGKS